MLWYTLGTQNVLRYPVMQTAAFMPPPRHHTLRGSAWLDMARGAPTFGQRGNAGAR